ncbi:MAG TPA: hypothetical protein VFI73_06400 [Candidatus Nitrosopolaris sp.]|nr:hypothetical protein [Candidatus Nitrosopolaris sp.]
METTIHNFELIHPIGEVPTNLNYNLKEQDSKKIMEKISWYLKEED